MNRKSDFIKIEFYNVTTRNRLKQEIARSRLIKFKTRVMEKYKRWRSRGRRVEWRNWVCKELLR